jgi:CRISPR/Cas system CSM-associated protein Csm2 small subunit
MNILQELDNARIDLTTLSIRDKSDRIYNVAENIEEAMQLIQDEEMKKAHDIIVDVMRLVSAYALKNDNKRIKSVGDQLDKVLKEMRKQENDNDSAIASLRAIANKIL